MSNDYQIEPEMLDIMKQFTEILNIFNKKLDEIKADEVLNTNLESLQTSINDLYINIEKSEKEYIEQKIDARTPDARTPDARTPDARTSNLEINNNIDNYTELEKQNLVALFCLYLMKIDKDSILNNNLSNYVENQTISSSINMDNYAYPELD